LENVYYNYGMAGRPPKNPKMRMDTDLRIPVTGEQKRIIMDATAGEPAGFAAWARGVLLKAAERLKKDKVASP
jgi:hypothetical protein